MACNEDRYTVGVDARYRSGPFSFDPTVHYQFGNRNVIAPLPTFTDSGAVAGRQVPVGKTSDAWLVDLRAGYQLGPLLLEGWAYTPPVTRPGTTRSTTIRYYQPLDTDTSYLADWGTQIIVAGS